MDNLYIENYNNKSELERLKSFLLATNKYSKMLLMGMPVSEIISIIEEPFLIHFTDEEVLSKIDNDEYNYDEECKKCGIDIEYDALAYACAKLNLENANSKEIRKNIIRMKNTK